MKNFIICSIFAVCCVFSACNHFPHKTCGCGCQGLGADNQDGQTFSCNEQNVSMSLTVMKAYAKDSLSQGSIFAYPGMSRMKYCYAPTLNPRKITEFSRWDASSGETTSFPTDFTLFDCDEIDFARDHNGDIIVYSRKGKEKRWYSLSGRCLAKNFYYKKVEKKHHHFTLMPIGFGFFPIPSGGSRYIAEEKFYNNTWYDIVPQSELTLVSHGNLPKVGSKVKVILHSDPFYLPPLF